MSEFISGKEALIALANGDEVEIQTSGGWGAVENCQIYQFLSGNHNYKFRLKPRTITINGIEVPAPFKPKHGDVVWFIDVERYCGYNSDEIGCGCEDRWIQFGAWRTEEEIKQVVAALRSIFK